MTEPVVVVGSPIDGHVEAVASALRARDVETVVLDTLAFPDGTIVSLGEDVDDTTCDGRKMAPSAVYVRDTYGSPLSVGVDAAAEMQQNWRRTLIAFREKSQVLLSLLARWARQGVPMYNPPYPDWSLSKPYQLALLGAAGLPVPRTLWTNDPAAVRKFAQGRRVAYKPVAGGAATRELGPEDLTDERLEALKGAPVTFQELLEGDNLRVYVLDGRVAAAFKVTSAELDYRQNDEAIEQVELGGDVLEDCVRAAEILGLRWAGIDLRGDAEERPRFLEANPSPMFMGFDSRAGTDLLGSLVSALASHAT